MLHLSFMRGQMMAISSGSKLQGKGLAGEVFSGRLRHVMTTVTRVGNCTTLGRSVTAGEMLARQSPSVLELQAVIASSGCFRA